MSEQNGDPPASVTPGNVFANFVQESVLLLRELEARRAFCLSVGEWMVESGNADAFNAWRAARAGNDLAPVSGEIRNAAPLEDVPVS